MGKGLDRALSDFDTFRETVLEKDILGKYSAPGYYFEKKRMREESAEEGNRRQAEDRARLLAAEAAARKDAEAEYSARYTSLSEQRGRDVASMEMRLSDWGFLPTDVAWKTGVEGIKSTYDEKLKQLGGDAFFSNITNRKTGFA